MEERTRTALPEGIDLMPPGAALAAVLEAVDLRRLAPEQLPVALRAFWRQRNHEEARLLDAVRECGLGDREAEGGRRETLDEFSADEARAALVLSKTGAWKLLALADDLVVRLAAVRQALHDGTIDEARARAFRDATEVLSAEHTDRIVELLLPEAPRMTAWALRQRIEQVAMALDPEWARKRYEEARRQRRLRARRTEAGTATLSGLDLPLDEVAGAVARIEALAAAAKAAGHPGLLDTIRADLYLALLSGRFAGWDEEDVVRALVAEATAADADADDRPTGPDAADPVDEEPTADEPPAEPGPVGAPSTRPPSRTRRARIELHLGLTTLLGLDDRPGEMPGWGPVHAELARDVVAAHVRGEWRVAVSGPDGSLAAALLTRRRPAGWGGGPSAAVIELSVDGEVLRSLDPAAHPAWARVLVDLQARLAGWFPPDGSNPGRRFPGDELARWIRMRDRLCIFPVCDAPAATADIDHTVAVHDHGTTVPANLGTPCRHDHRLKHEGGWGLRQTAPGRFVWTSRCGAHYERPPRPVVPALPDPDPPPEGRRSAWRPFEYAADRGGVWTVRPAPVGPAPPARPGPPGAVGPPSGADDDPPPF